MGKTYLHCAGSITPPVYLASGSTWLTTQVISQASGLFSAPWGMASDATGTYLAISDNAGASGSLRIFTTGSFSAPLVSVSVPNINLVGSDGTNFYGSNALTTLYKIVPSGGSFVMGTSWDFAFAPHLSAIGYSASTNLLYVSYQTEVSTSAVFTVNPSTGAVVTQSWSTGYVFARGIVVRCLPARLLVPLATPHLSVSCRWTSIRDTSTLSTM
jgi:hypothetical protein